MVTRCKLLFLTLRKLLLVGAVVGVIFLFYQFGSISNLREDMLKVVNYFGVESISLHRHSISANVYQFQFEDTVENSEERALLPLYKTISAITQQELAKKTRHYEVDPGQFISWTRSHGDNYSSKYSTLDQITKDNVTKLEVAWSLNTDNFGEWKTNVESNPIVANGLMYFATPQNYIVAVDVKTGILKWSYKCDSVPARRGLVWWKGTNSNSQIFFPTTAGKLIALQAETGRPVLSFGEDGKVLTGLATSAPIVQKNQLFVAVNSPAKVESYDVRTGKKYWSTSLTVGKQKLLGGAPWAGMSLDDKRGLLFVTTGNPKPPFFGGNRPGKNLYTNSVVALDIQSGHIVWFWQEVEHGLWDYDIPSPPILTTVERYKHQVDVVVALTKIGNVIVLERSSGKPLFDYRLRRAPTSNVPGEKTAPYQPDLELPEPVGTPTFSLADVTDISEKNHNSVIGQLGNATYGFFQPPVLGKTLISFGLHGGAEWPGGAVDHGKGMLFLTVNNIPWKLRLSLIPTKSIQSPESRGTALYKANCESCHLPNRTGIVSVSGEKELEYVPSLVGVSKIKAFSGKMQLSNWKERHRGLLKELSVTPEDLNEIFEYFRFVDAELIKEQAIISTEIWSELLDYEDYPGSKPPWGEIVAVDLNEGKIAWRKPFGEYKELTARGVPTTGQENFGGLFVTKTGLIFATGTPDRKIRAYDALDGLELWSYTLPAAGSAPPLTYKVDGIQYVTVVASGGMFHGFKHKASSIVTFQLSDDSLKGIF
jgi:quinoprotein glucose dehydrogenase